MSIQHKSSCAVYSRVPQFSEEIFLSPLCLFLTEVVIITKAENTFFYLFAYTPTA